jgi:ubiquinone/menaquinone biosynthesis C-methylase UbiE
MIWVLPVVGLLLVVALAYWQLIVAEGTYLGPRIVTWLYDWAASAYERIKQFDPGAEQWFLGLPLAKALDMIPAPFVLDVGTGTGRLPRALLFQPRFRGRVVGVDLSRRMLRQAVRLSDRHTGRVTFVWQNALRLPFLDDTFDAVTCLEVLEFTPDPKATLEEMIRVLRPGGILLTSNRIGPDARYLPGRAFDPTIFRDMLERMPLEEIKTQTWQVDYDLIWACKSGPVHGGSVRPLPEVLRCPVCEHHPIVMRDGAYRCAECGRAYPVAEDGVIEMAHSASHPS